MSELRLLYRRSVIFRGASEPGAPTPRLDRMIVQCLQEAWASDEQARLEAQVHALSGLTYVHALADLSAMMAALLCLGNNRGNGCRYIQQKLPFPKRCCALATPPPLQFFVFCGNA